MKIKKINSKKNILSCKKLSISILAFFILIPATSWGRTFDPHNIITDETLFDGSAMSKTAIQQFLSQKNSVLASHSQVVDGRSMNAAEIIWEVGNKNNVSQKFLLTNLEKEQGLLSKSTASEKALDWAMGFGCYGGTCREQYKGFYAQLEAAAETQRIYKEKANLFSFKVGQQSTTVDGYNVTPVNQATANLYIYTPHVGNAPELGINQPYGANKLFWRIWHRYFSHQKYLDGQVLSNNGTYWLIKGNERHRFISNDIYTADYSANYAIAVGNDELQNYPEGEPIRFANNTVVRAQGSGQMFLIQDQQKRPILDSSALALLNNYKIATEGTTSDNIQIAAVNDSWLDPYTLGTSISASSLYPQGKLVVDETGDVWELQDGLKHYVAEPVWKNRYNAATPEKTTLAAIEQFPSGSPATLKDGTFVKNNGSYYLITDGKRMKINNSDSFKLAFGYNRQQSAISVSTTVLEYHPADELIEYADDTIVDPPTPVTPPAQPGTVSHATSFISMQPDGLILLGGQTYTVTMQFKNEGSATWGKSDVKLNVYDQGKTTSLFNAPKNISFNEDSVLPGGTATFTISLTAPSTVSGVLGEMFRLSYSGIEFGGIGKFIIVNASSGNTAEIVSHNLPVAVKNTWGPQQIEMKIKNTSKETIWLSNKTALEVYNSDGTPSIFYDPNDWVRKEVAAVPINQTQIKPGETGIFKFTVDPNGVAKGVHTLTFKLKMLDKDGKAVFINGMHQWQRLIRVD